MTGSENPTWISRFSDMTRQAVAYRQGRVLLAGLPEVAQPHLERDGVVVPHQELGHPSIELACGNGLDAGKLAQGPAIDVLRHEAHRTQRTRGPVLIDGDQAIFLPTFGAATVVVAMSSWKGGLRRAGAANASGLVPITGSAANVGDPLVRDPRVVAISFTGSNETGAELRKIAFTRAS